MIRPTRCSAAPTACRSSARSSTLAARLLRPGGRVGVEHDDTTAAATVDTVRSRRRVHRRDVAARPRRSPPVRHRDAQRGEFRLERHDANMFDCADPGQRSGGHRVGDQRRSRAAGWSSCPPTPCTASAPTPSTAPPSPRCLRPRGAAATCRSPSSSARGTPSTAWCTRCPHAARELIRAFWPGALSLVVQQAPSLQWDLGDAHGHRHAAHAAAPRRDRAAARGRARWRCRVPTSPGRPAAVTAADARDQLGDLVEVYLEAGPSAQRPASTIVDLTGAQPRVLRRGAGHRRGHRRRARRRGRDA